MRHLNIDMSNLIDAFEGGYETISYFLDLETGEVISVTEDARGIHDILFESYFDEQTQTVDWESAFENEHVLDWERELVKYADRVEAGHGVTIIAIPSQDSSEGYSDMEAFIDIVRNPLLRNPWNEQSTGAVRSGISRMCYWIIPVSATAGFSSSGSDFSRGYLSGWRSMISTLNVVEKN